MQQATAGALVSREVVIVLHEAQGMKKNDAEARDGTLSVMERNFVPPGYHAPILKLSWNRLNDKVATAIDHDIGDGVLMFIYDTKSFSWQQH